MLGSDGWHRLCLHCKLVTLYGWVSLFVHVCFSTATKTRHAYKSKIQGPTLTNPKVTHKLQQQEAGAHGEECNMGCLARVMGTRDWCDTWSWHSLWASFCVNPLSFPIHFLFLHVPVLYTLHMVNYLEDKATDKLQLVRLVRAGMGPSRRKGPWWLCVWVLQSLPDSWISLLKF